MTKHENKKTEPKTDSRHLNGEVQWREKGGGGTFSLISGKGTNNFGGEKGGKKK